MILVNPLGEVAQCQVPAFAWLVAIDITNDELVLESADALTLQRALASDRVEHLSVDTERND